MGNALGKLTTALLLFALAGGGTTLAAQENGRLTIAAGVSEYDLSGVDETFTMAARFDVPYRRPFLFEGSLGIMFPIQQFGDTTTLILPEVQVQAELPRRLSPYLGVGLGLAVDIRESVHGGTQIDPTFSAAGGVRFRLVDRFALRAELRLRGHETDFVGSTADITGGLIWMF
jgi:hypothetical protein